MQLELYYFKSALAEINREPPPPRNTGQLKDTKRLKTAWLGLVSTLHLCTGTPSVAAVSAKSHLQSQNVAKIQYQTDELFCPTLTFLSICLYAQKQLTNSRLKNCVPRGTNSFLSVTLSIINDESFQKIYILQSQQWNISILRYVGSLSLKNEIHYLSFLMCEEVQKTRPNKNFLARRKYKIKKLKNFTVSFFQVSLIPSKFDRELLDQL